MTDEQNTDFSANYTCTECGRKGGYRANRGKNVCQRCVNAANREKSRDTKEGK